MWLLPHAYTRDAFQLPWLIIQISLLIANVMARFHIRRSKSWAAQLVRLICRWSVGLWPPDGSITLDSQSSLTLVPDSVLQTSLFEARQLGLSTVFLFSRSLSSEGIWIKLQEPQGFFILSWINTAQRVWEKLLS